MESLALSAATDADDPEEDLNRIIRERNSSWMYDWLLALERWELSSSQPASAVDIDRAVRERLFTLRVATVPVPNRRGF